VNGNFFTKEQAAQVGIALRKGETIITPGVPSECYEREVGPPLPDFVYQSLVDYRRELKSNFGVGGSTAGGTQNEKTVRGKVVQKQQDVDRIGGGASVYVEQFSEQIFNWFVQLMFVYYDEPHVASILGANKAREWVTIQAMDMAKRKFIVEVKDGSMLPKDATTKQNNAIQLFEAKALDPISLYEAMDFPNPVETAQKLFIWMTNPQALFAPPPSAGQPPQSPGAPPGAPPMPGAPPPQVVPNVGEPRTPMPQPNTLPNT
jgi:hypothetical protein